MLQPSVSPRILELELIDIIQETPTVKTFRLSLGREELVRKPGQIIRVIQEVEDPRGKERPFTVSNSPTEKSYIQFTTRISESPFKQKLNSLKIGDRLSVKGPFGGFILQEDYSKPAVMLAGGIGITPFRCMIEYATINQVPMPITLIYGNRTLEEIAFNDFLKECCQLNPNLTVFHILSEPEKSNQKWEGLTGYITEKVVRDSVEDIDNSIFYCCGPPAMVESLVNTLKGMQIPLERIKTEKFTGY